MSNKKYYYIANPSSNKGFDEVTESEFFTVFGDEAHRDYASKVYCGEMSIGEIPEELRETVISVVTNRVERFGEYNSQIVSSNEFQDMLEEVL